MITLDVHARNLIVIFVRIGDAMRCDPAVGRTKSRVFLVPRDAKLSFTCRDVTSPCRVYRPGASVSKRAINNNADLVHPAERMARVASTLPSSAKIDIADPQPLKG